MFSRSRVLIALSAVVMLFALHLRASEPMFKLQDTWILGGNGSWDYMAVDPSTHILYIARLNRIMLVDLQSGKLVTEITGLTHAHGIALDDHGKIGYLTDGGADTVVVFDRSTYRILATIPAGKNPDSVLFEPTRQRVFAFNGASHDATVIDAATNTVIRTVPLPGKPEFSVTDGTGNVFVNIEGTNAVLRLDSANLKITASWPLAPGEGPSGLAIDIAGHRLFSVCDNRKMIVLDSESGKVITFQTIGEGADAVAFDATRQLVFSSNGESGTLTVIRAVAPYGYDTVQTLSTKLGARTIALEPSSGTVYTVSAALGPKPPSSPSNPKRRPAILADSFVVLAYSR